MGETITRRRLLGAAGAAGAAPLLLGSAPASRHRRATNDALQRPNILWLVSEDNGPGVVGAYGNPLARTPAIDALAARGVRYDAAWASAPVCAPARFAILTGMHAESSGPAHHMRAEGRIPDWLVGFPSYLKGAGYYTTNNFKTDYNAAFDNARAGWHESGPLAHWGNRPDPAMPFFAVFNFDTSHETGSFVGVPVHTDPAAVEVPPYLPDTPTIRADIARNHDAMAQTDLLIDLRLRELELAGLADDTIVIYYGDHGGWAPRSKRFCYDLGLRVPFIVHVPDRFAHLAPAPPGTVLDAPVSLVDLAPTMLSLAGLPVPDHFHGVAFAGPHRRGRRYVFGARSRMDERYDLVRTVRDGRYQYIRNAMPHLPHGQHITFMWGQASYRDWEQRWLDGRLDEVQSRFWRSRPAEELYDLDRDPHQVHDLANDKAHRGVLRRLRAALDTHIVEVNDNGWIPEGLAAEGYDASREPGAHPLRDAMRLSELAAARDPRHLVALGRATGDPDPVLRYWAVLGHAMLADRIGPVEVARLTHVVRSEPVAQVRIAGAEALVRTAAAQPAMAPVAAEAVDVLAKDAAPGGDPRVRLQALNGLTAAGALARPALPVAVQAAADPDEYVRNAGTYLVRRLTGTYVPAP